MAEERSGATREPAAGGEARPCCGGNHGVGDPCDPRGPHDLRPGDIVRNFKRETVTDGSQRYLYRIVAFARHSETLEDLVVYEALYPPFETWCRPLAMFMGEVDHAKYPDIQQRWRFQRVDPHEC